MFEIFDHWNLSLFPDQHLPQFNYVHLKDVASEHTNFSHVRRMPFPYFLEANFDTTNTAQKFSSTALVDHLSQLEKRCTHHSSIETTKLFDHSQFSEKKFCDLLKLIPYSIVISHLERNNRILEKTSLLLAEKYNTPVGVNAYITPPHGKTFNCHFDPHDIIVLQIFGIKKWTIYKPQLNPQDNFEILLEVTLHPGDVLFIPEGYYHEAESLELHSLHFSFGLYQASPPKILEWFKRDYSYLAFGSFTKNQMVHLNFMYQLKHQRVNQTGDNFLIFKNDLEKKIILLTFNKEIRIDLDLQDWLLEFFESSKHLTLKSESENLELLRQTLITEIHRSN